MKQPHRLSVTVLILALAILTGGSPTASPAIGTSPIRHVLLLSVDGFHASDLAHYVKANPSSTLAGLAKTGTTFTNASSAKPSDSFPGLLAMVTGGTPASTGVYYDDSYDRALSPPGSNCATAGTEVVYDESIDKNPDAIDGGGGIDATLLPLDPAKGCTPVYPHSFLRVNTIFEVAKAAGLRTAWSDKHPAYEFVNGPSGSGVDDLFTPEINANETTTSVQATQAYDDIKVQAILNEIDGKDHTGTSTVGTPAVFGMNFQAVSVAQKLGGACYGDCAGPTSVSLAAAIDHTDQSIGKMVAQLQARGLLASTLVIVTAKHAQAPLDNSRKRVVDKKLIPSIVEGVQEGLGAQVTQDDTALIWLTDQSQTDAVAQALIANRSLAAIQKVYWGETLKLVYPDPATDSRVPDLVVQPSLGVIYTKTTATKTAEHGGWTDDDTHVAMLVSSPALPAATVKIPVTTTQIAPTILKALSLDPQALQAVQQEGTASLPGLSVLGF